MNAGFFGRGVHQIVWMTVFRRWDQNFITVGAMKRKAIFPKFEIKRFKPLQLGEKNTFLYEKYGVNESCLRKNFQFLRTVAKNKDSIHRS